MDYSIKPIITWPGELRSDRDRTKADFGTTYAATLRHLQREVEALGGDNVLFQLAVDRSDIRIDGGLKSSANPSHPGIVVIFNSELGQLSYCCDRYKRWRDNLRAITIVLQYLRRIDDHGVNKKGAQYLGYKQLPAAGQTDTGRPKIETPEQAAKFITDALDPERNTDALDPERNTNSEKMAEMIVESSFIYEAAYKEASQRLHPDKPTGSHEEFIDLQEAAAVLRKHHGL
jgi:hypothetical protein